MYQCCAVLEWSLDFQPGSHNENQLVPLHVKIEARINLSFHMNENRFHCFKILENRISTLIEPTSNSQSHVPNYDFLNNSHQLGRQNCCLRFGLGTNYKKKLNLLFFARVLFDFFQMICFSVFFFFFLHWCWSSHILLLFFFMLVLLFFLCWCSFRIDGILLTWVLLFLHWCWYIFYIVDVVLLALVLLLFSCWCCCFFAWCCYFFCINISPTFCCYCSCIGVVFLSLVLIWYFPLLPCVDGSLEHQASPQSTQCIELSFFSFFLNFFVQCFISFTIFFIFFFLSFLQYFFIYSFSSYTHLIPL